jgi:hypothetical protein
MKTPRDKPKSSDRRSGIPKSVPVPPRPDPQSEEDRAVDEIVRRGPSGAFAVAGIATAIVVLIFFAFYLFIYLPRGAVQ